MKHEGRGGIDPQQPGGLLVPTMAMRDAFVKDYEAMAGLIFGDAPSLEAVLASVEALNNIVNTLPLQHRPCKGRVDERLFQW